MSNIAVCARFRPLSSKERRDDGDSVCVQCLDSETFIFKDEKEGNSTFTFDRVFYENSEQAQVYEFLALPIVQDAVKCTNGTIITYGQTGAGKTYSMEGPGILESDEEKKGLLPRVVGGIFECIKSSKNANMYSVKLSMVEIYMERVRDLLDLAKDNIQIMENKAQGILLNGITEISIKDPMEALQSLASGIANRAVGETQMNITSSRSHCVYIFIVQQELKKDNRSKTSKLVLVDLAGSEKAEKSGAEGRVLEEAKSINKSLSALGNVINALTSGSSVKTNHIPYRDSKLTRILQDALGGNSRTALLCCCSPSPSNAPESLSTLRFGARASHIKASPRVKCNEDKSTKKLEVPSPTKDESCERILHELRKRLDEEDVNLLEELFMLEGIFFDPNSEEELELAFEDVTLKTIVSLQQAVEELACEVKELKKENKALKDEITRAKVSDAQFKETGEASRVVPRILGLFNFFSMSWFKTFLPLSRC
ncbi:kinesin-like protein KIN-1 [Humulus lupulus]|uniref:kinesin-like protein KIN-1 n=1 Tax=Humulus lupulus TaxID=3486 RepID=UPI002B4057E5|nr:kinesin-like protein KIN-1 [Humulus lupulus]